MELCEATKIAQRSIALESETGEAVAITYYSKNDIPQIGEQVWIDFHTAALARALAA